MIVDLTGVLTDYTLRKEDLLTKVLEIFEAVDNDHERNARQKYRYVKNVIVDTLRFKDAEKGKL